MKKTLLITALSFICNYSFAQLTFSKVFYDLSTGFGIQGNSVVQTPDKGYMITGGQIFGGLVMKLDSTGVQTWKKYYNQPGGSLQNGLFCIAPTNDSCYIVAGAMASSLDANIFCMKIDTLGDTLWTRTLPTVEISQIFSVQQTYDDGYIMAGNYRSPTAPYVRTGVVKLDSTGNLHWNQVITTTGYNSYTSTIKQTPDSGYVVWGTLNNTGTGIYSYLIKLSPSGIIQWSKTYNYLVYGQLNGSLEILTDGFISFLIADNNPHRGILMKIDFSGNIIWSKSSGILNGGGPPFVSKIHQTHDGGFVIAIGYPIDYGPGNIWRADSSGNLLWSKETVMNPMEAIETYDNGYLILGNGNGGPPNYNPQFGVIKTDSLGNAPNCINWSGLFGGFTDTCVATNFTTTSAPIGPIAYINTTINIPSISDANGCLSNIPINVNEFDSDKQLLDIYPNPSSGNLMITFEKTIKNGSIEILNILGESIFTENILLQSKREINLENISDGIYFVKVFDGEKSYCKKLIVEHD